MVKEHLSIPTALCIRASGATTSTRARVSRPGTMAPSNTKENSQKVKKLEKVDLISMAITMREISPTDNLRDKVHTILLTAVKFIRENSKKIIL